MYALKMDKLSLDCIFEGILSGFDMLLPDRLNGKTALLDESDGTVRGYTYLEGVRCSDSERGGLYRHHFDSAVLLDRPIQLGISSDSSCLSIPDGLF